MAARVGSQRRSTYIPAHPDAYRPQKKNIALTRRRLSFEAWIVIWSTIFAFASSAFLYLLPPSPSANYLHGEFKLWQGNAYVTIVKYPLNELQNARLYEDGKPLKQPNSDPQDISAKGNGLYWLYLGSDETAPTLMFSSSDNTDPNTNGRKYRLE